MSNEIRTTVTDATATQKGSTTLSTDALTIAGIDNQTSVTPQNVKAKLGTQEFGKIAIGQGTDQPIYWGMPTSPDESILINYNPITKNIEFKSSNSGDVRSICVDSTAFSNKFGLAEPTCIIPTPDGELNFSADPPIILTPTPNGVNISFGGSGSGIQTINTIAPDTSDNFNITATAPYIFDSITNGINLKDDGSIPYTYTTASGTKPFVNNNFSIFSDDLAGEFFTRNNSIGLRYANARTDLGGLIRLTTNDQVLNGEDNERAVTPFTLRAILGTLDNNKVALAKGSTSAIQYYSLVPVDDSIEITIDDATKEIRFKATGAASDPNIITISDSTTITRIAQDRTIYIINNINPVKATLQLPETARLGFWFRVIGINGGCNINTNVSGGQFLKWKDNNSESTLVSDDGWQDFYIFCYEENVRFKWLTF